jgi:hypothetical protein
MCRRPIYFKGFHKVQEQWAEEAWEEKISETFGEAIDALVESSAEYKQEFPDYSAFFDRQTKEELKDIDKTIRFLKSENVHEEDIAECLAYEDYYSDRKVGSKNQGRDLMRQKPHPKHEHRRQKQIRSVNFRGR